MTDCLLATKWETLSDFNVTELSRCFQPKSFCEIYLVLNNWFP